MTKYYLYNPLSFDVSTTYALDVSPETYNLPSEKITEFENEAVFTHMRNYLVEIVLNERNIIHFDHNRAKVSEEVTKIIE